MTDISDTDEQTFEAFNEPDQIAKSQQMIQENLEKSMKQFEEIKLAAKKEIQNEVEKAKEQIKNIQQSVSGNIKNLQESASSGMPNNLSSFDSVKKTTEKSTSDIMLDLNNAETSIRDAMEIANKSAQFSEDTERLVTKSMIEIDEAMSDKAQSVVPVTPSLPGMNQLLSTVQPQEQPVVPVPSLPSQSSVTQDADEKVPDWISAMDEVLEAQIDAENQLKD